MTRLPPRRCPFSCWAGEPMTNAISLLTIVTAPVAAVWWTLTQWWFWIGAGTASILVLATMYRGTWMHLVMRARRAGSNDRDPGHRKGQS